MVKMQKINYYHFKTFLTTPYTGNDIERFKKIEESVSRNNQLSMEEKFNLLERFKDEKDYFFVLNGEKEAERLCNNCKNFCLAIKYCEKCVRNYLKNQTWTSGNEEVDSIIVDFQQNTLTPNMVIEWIPYDNFEKFNNRMFWKEGPYDKWNSEFVKLERFGKREVILKEMKGFEKELVIAKNFLLISSKWGGIEQCYGLTKDNSSNKYMLVMAKCGYSLESYLENEGTNLDFLERLKIIFEIIKGLFRIHSENFVHGKINTENVLYLEHKNDWYLSLNAVDSSDSKKYDIYGFGLIVEKLFFMDNINSDHEILRSIMIDCLNLNSGISSRNLWDKVEKIIRDRMNFSVSDKVFC